MSGFLSGKLKIKLNNGKSLSFGITQGKGAVKQILTSLGFQGEAQQKCLTIFKRIANIYIKINGFCY